MTITRQEILSRLLYDEGTGQFTRVVASGGWSIGQIAGSINTNGHRQLNIGGKLIMAHRVAWFLVHGKWPAAEIDHINGVKDDNRISNLREVTHSQNLQNLRKARADNKSAGLLGVYRASTKGSRWCAHITINGKRKNLGSYGTKHEAHQAYLTAKRELHSYSTI